MLTQGQVKDVETNPDIAPCPSPPSLNGHESLWTEIPYYTVLRFTATLDIVPQIAVTNSGATSGFAVADSRKKRGIQVKISGWFYENCCVLNFFCNI